MSDITTSEEEKDEGSEFKEALLAKLRALKSIAKDDEDKAYELAVEALLEYIDDADISEAFDAMFK